MDFFAHLWLKVLNCLKKMKNFYRKIFFSFIILLICIDFGSAALPFLALITKIAARFVALSTRFATFGSRVAHITRMSRVSVLRSTRLLSQKSKLLSRSSRLLESVSRVSYPPNAKWLLLFLLNFNSIFRKHSLKMWNMVKISWNQTYIKVTRE